MCLFIYSAHRRAAGLIGVSAMSLLRGVQSRYGQGLAEYALILALIAIVNRPQRR